MVKSRGMSEVGRNAFDLTNRHVYSQKVAKITPVKALHTYPDDYFEVDMSEFSQNKVPMNTAAFLSGTKEMLAYFVPYNTVWHNFNQYQATREDPESTLLKEQGIVCEPRMLLYDLYRSAFYFTLGKFFLTSYLPVTALAIFARANVSVPTNLNIPDLITLLKDGYYANGKMWKWDDMLRDAFEFSRKSTSARGNLVGDYSWSFYEDNDPTTVPTYYETVTNMFGNFIWCDWVQKLDMLGYGNIYPYLHEMLLSLEDRLNKAILENTSSLVIPGTITFDYDEVNYNLGRQFDVFRSSNIGLNNIFEDITDKCLNQFSQMSVNGASDPSGSNYVFVNVYSIYAYNKCFYDYMRNVYYDTDYSVYNYNCDFIDGKSLLGSTITNEYLPMRWYHLECHQWKKDMFTGVLPDNQLGQVSSVILQGDVDIPSLTGVTGSSDGRYNTDPLSIDVVTDLRKDADGNLYGYSDDVYSNVMLFHDHTVSTSPSSSSTALALNVLALKRAEAIQEYRQDLMRAGNRTKDIFKQVYGTDPRSSMDETPYFIEVASNDINVNPIVSTAQTGDGINQSLGDIAARTTISGNNLHFKFSTKDFGVIIFLSYIVPESFYNSYRIDPFNTHLDQESHGLPYFQNLGLQPVIGESLSNIGDVSVRSRVLGYAPPYIEFKTDIDLVHGDFVDVFMPRTNADDTDTAYQGEMSHWVVARTDMQQETAVSLRNFYIDPRIVNNVFTFSAEDDYSTDHFFTFCTINVNAVRAFSELGLPRF